MNDLRVFKGLGHKVGIFCLNTNKHWVDTSEYNESTLWDDFRTEAIDTNSFFTLINAFFRTHPFQIARFYKTFIDDRISSLMQEQNIDLLVYQGLAMTQYQRSFQGKKVYRVHNIEFNLWNNLSKNTPNLISKYFKYWLAQSLKTYEAQELKDMSSMVTLSDSEGNILKELYPEMIIEAIPISIQADYKQIYSTEKIGLLFIGSLDWQPNLEGLEWFLSNVYLEINHIPLTIAGKGDFNCNLKNVTVISNYESTEELLASHRLMVVPLLSGAGIRIKILEAMKFGMPLISTRIGAEGINGLQGSIILEDTKENWISQILKAYNHASDLSELSQNAKASFENYYSVEVVALKWKKILSKI
jgi:glycosyltransferase involved in cell wall biosynthesis